MKTFTFFTQYDIVDRRSVVVQYSNWEIYHPILQTKRACVSVSRDNYWQSVDCNFRLICVCQS